MIDIHKVQLVLKEYLKNYDVNDKQIKQKIEHIYRVSELSRRLATSIGFDEENVILAQVIGLLHDIGRFEQIKRYHTFIDKDSVNHGELGCEILFDQGLIKDFIDDRQYDKTIRDAIINHNRSEINPNLRASYLFHSKIIRDADKTDILYLSTLEDQVDTVYGSSNFRKEIISEDVYNDFIDKRKIDYHHISTSADVVLCHLAYVFDYNFDDLLKYISDRKYLDKLFELISFEDTDSNQKFKKCYCLTKDFINKRTK